IDERWRNVTRPVGDQSTIISGVLGGDMLTLLLKIKAISFDGDMTLWDFRRVMRDSLALALGELRRRVPGRASADLTIDRMIEIRNSVAAELKGSVVNLEVIRLQAFRRTAASVGCADDTLASDLNALYLKHRFEDIELYPDVIPVLDALRADFCVGLLSNGNGYPERCGLPGRFRFTVFSQDLGVEKPDAGMFYAACRRADCAPQELMHVGDSLQTDVAGANGVGAVSVWLNRDGRENNAGIVPDIEIRSLAELLPLLGTNGGQHETQDHE
ncbi:MAG: HAD family hydrolase, partial [Anaerolineae bacterium]|nr:HAD family hydrolase [Anaerolineae bacterium]